MAPVLAPAAPILPARLHAEGAVQPSASLVQALRDHDEQPDADHAAQVLQGIHEAGPADRAIRGDDPLDLAALQARLGPADALVVFGQQGEELLACVVRRGRVQVFRRLARWREVQQAWRLVRFQLHALGHGAGPPRAQWPKLAKRAQARLQALHELVWSPLADTLADARRLLLVPTADLASLPFAALHDGMTCLAQRHLLAQVASLPLALRGLLAPAGTPLVALAEPLPAGRVQALLDAGASRVLACGWPVDDSVNAAFVDRFQQQLQRGRMPAEALSEAQAGLMVNHPHPAFWAGFVLHGGW